MKKKQVEDIYAFGADLGGNNLRWGLVNQKGDILMHEKVASKGIKSKDKLLDHIFNTVRDGVIKCQNAGYKIKGVGIGIPGLIVKDKGYVLKSPNFAELNSIYFQRLLEERVKLPVIIENDVNAWAWGEYAFGAAKGFWNFMVMTLGTGVGGGVVVDKKLIDGRDGTAGEVGHITIYPDGIKCNCGNTGCLEKYASATGIVDNLKQHINDEGAIELVRIIGKDIGAVTSIDIYNQAKKGNAFAIKLFKGAGVALGIAIAGLVNLLNLEAIIIGGGVSAAWDIIVPELRKEMMKRAFSLPARRCQIMKNDLGDNGGILGMAKMVFDM